MYICLINIILLNFCNFLLITLWNGDILINKTNSLRPQILYLTLLKMLMSDLGLSPTEWPPTEWQRPLSGVHSIMRVTISESAQPHVEDEGRTPTPFHSFYHHVQSCSVRSSWEGRYAPPVSTLSLNMYSVLINIMVVKCVFCSLRTAPDLGFTIITFRLSAPWTNEL